jgi:isopentenyl diphosphate isomerase/L-lactate dehydrogenase-like FMN-dependent dehydrogenase
MIKSKRQFPDVPYFISLIEWKFPTLFRKGVKISRAQSVTDLAIIAKKRVPKVVYDYVEGSALDEVSYQRSREAFKKVEYTTHILRDVSKIDPSVDIFGKKVDLPIFFSPTGYTRFMYHAGEPAVASVAKDNNLIYALSTMGTTSPSELESQVPNSRKWFQLYVMKNREDSLSVINQARDSGFEALILTVDTPVMGLRIRDIKNGLTIPPRIKFSTIFAIAKKPIWWLNLITTKKLEFAAFRGWNKPLTELANVIFDPAISFDDVTWLKSVWNGPIIVKGVQNVEDARKLASMGIDGIIVSNHGGRQLDRGPVPLEILPEIVAAVGVEIDVFIDGGIMSGQDVYAALALGAKAIFIGRAYLYGAMAGGQQGVEKVIEIMKRDLINTMALTGARNISEVREMGARIRNI